MIQGLQSSMFPDLVKLLIGLVWPAVLLGGFWMFRHSITALMARVGTVKVGLQGVELSGSPQPLASQASTSEQGVSPTPTTSVEQDSGSETKKISEYFNPQFRDLLDAMEAQADASLAQIMKNLGKGKEAALKHMYVDYATGLYLERASKYIFGSQIDAINFLMSVGGTASKFQIRQYYVIAAAVYPAFYTNYTFDQWLGFLVGQNLITIDGETVTLTPGGRAIVPYMQAWGYLQTRPVG